MIREWFKEMWFGAKPQEPEVKSGVQLIKEERLRQINFEGFSPRHDDCYTKDELAKAAACYALPKRCRNPYWGKSGKLLPHYWPWAERYWKPSPDDRIRELAKAGALIAAEIDRLQRKKQEEQR